MSHSPAAALQPLQWFQRNDAGPSQRTPPPDLRKSRLHLVYFLLAAFDILTIGVTLIATHSTTTAFERTVQSSREWATRVRTITNLELLAQQTDAPGNDVFDTHAVAAERIRRDRALAAFDARWLQITRELAQNVSAAERAPLEDDLAEIRQLMDAVASESDTIFAYFEQGQAARAASRMASMDRTYGALVVRIAQTINRVEAIQLAHLQVQVATAESMRRTELIIVGLIVLIVIAVTIYGHKIGQTIRQSGEANWELLSRLQVERTRLSHYADNVAHELRGPLSKLNMGCELILARDRTVPEYQEAFLDTMEQADRLKAIVEGLLFLARLSNTASSTPPEAVDVRHELLHLLDYYDAAAAKAGVTLRLDQEGEIEAHVHKTLFQRLIGNLVSNALAHTPRDGDVVVRAREVDRKLIVEVEDNGEGMSEADSARVFDRFVRGESGRTDETGRLGLGLPIAKSIVELHGGEIALSSAPGRGTCVRVSIPLDMPSA